MTFCFYCDLVYKSYILAWVENFSKSNKYLSLHGRSPTLLSCQSSASHFRVSTSATFLKKLFWKHFVEEKKNQFKEENVLFIEPVCCKFNPKWRGASVIVSDISLVGVGPDGLSQHTAQLECEAFDLLFDLCFSSHPCWATSAGRRILQAWVASSLSQPDSKGCYAVKYWTKPHV